MQRIPFVDLNTQYKSIKNELDSAIEKVISKSAFIGGHFVESFEKKFAEFCNVKHCVGVGNGTDALFLALKSLDIGPGDEVITAANSFIATSEAITMTGAKVVFVDINPETFAIDVNKIEEKISAKTKAVIPVHLFGHPADMDPILNIAQKYKIKIVEDAAQAHGAVYKGRQVGSIGDMACFSFYPGKNLGAFGDGGAIVTNNDRLAEKARMLANHGRTDKYNHKFEGVNSRLDGLQAAILEIKLNHLPEWNRHRRKNAYMYNRCLQMTDLVLPVEQINVEAVYHLYVVKVKKEIRQHLIDFLKFKGIATGIHYPIALPNLKAYAYLNHSSNDFPQATKAAQELLSLPMFPELTESQINYIAENIKMFLRESKEKHHITEGVAF